MNGDRYIYCMIDFIHAFWLKFQTNYSLVIFVFDFQSAMRIFRKQKNNV